MKIAVIDGQCGGIGQVIIERRRMRVKENVEILALGTNSAATIAMLKEGATGKNAIIYNVQELMNNVDLIVGVLSIIMANSMRGELTPNMAESINCSKPKKLLFPIHRGNVELIGYKATEPLPHLVELLIHEIVKYLEG